jgi:hypothetical protein
MAWLHAGSHELTCALKAAIARAIRQSGESASKMRGRCHRFEHGGKLACLHHSRLGLAPYQALHKIIRRLPRLKTVVPTRESCPPRAQAGGAVADFVAIVPWR